MSNLERILYAFYLLLAIPLITAVILHYSEIKDHGLFGAWYSFAIPVSLFVLFYKKIKAT